MNLLPGQERAECEYCGSKQTIPNTDDEKRLKLYERANKLRFENEFDKPVFIEQDANAGALAEWWFGDHGRPLSSLTYFLVGEGVGFERIRRITGYLVGTVERFNNGKRAEEHDRVKHTF